MNKKLILEQIEKTERELENLFSETKDITDSKMEEMLEIQKKIESLRDQVINDTEEETPRKLYF